MGVVSMISYKVCMILCNIVIYMVCVLVCPALYILCLLFVFVVQSPAPKAIGLLLVDIHRFVTTVPELDT